MAYINGKKVISNVICMGGNSGSSGTPIELATTEEMQAALVSENVGKIYKFVGETNEIFTNGNLYQVVEE